MRVHKVIASGFGSGYLPVAPGTAGSIAGVVLLYLFNFMLNETGADMVVIHLLNFLAVFILVFAGVYSIKKVHSVWPHDAPLIVIDEIAGVWIAAYAIPFNWKYYLYALIIFRVFDILKPFYIRKLDNLKTDWSVMLDDMLAGFYSFIVLQVFIHFNIV